MAKIGFIAVGNVSHLARKSGPFEAYCEAELYDDKGKATLYAGPINGTEVCPTCISKEKLEDDGRLLEYARTVKALSNEDLLQEVYSTLGALSSDSSSADEYDRSERELVVSQAELNARLTACGFLSKGA